MNFNQKKIIADLNTPLMRNHSIPVNVLKFYTDINGTVINKNTAPAPLRTKFPFFLFGGFDMAGGYRIGLSNVVPMPGTSYLMTYVHGVDKPFLAFTGLNDIKSRLLVGDIIQVYTDDVENPNYFIFMVIQNVYASMGSIVGNTQTMQEDNRIGRIEIDGFQMFSANQSQFDEPVHMIRFDNIGTFKDNQVQPRVFRDPYTKQLDFIEFGSLGTPFLFQLDQYIEIGHYMLFATDEMRFNFKIKI
jgi:hypothetical protein